MRHRKSGRKLGRNSTHRKAMWRNMVTSLLEHDRITTTEAKAKELRRYVERTISKAVRAQDLVDKGDKRSKEEQVRLVHAMRMAARLVHSKDVLHKLFFETAGKLRDRPGGYTRIIKIAPRSGDAADMAIIELVLPAQSETGSETGSDRAA